MTASADRIPSLTRPPRAPRSPLTHLAVAVLLLAMVQGFVIKPYRVPSESMTPTLLTGDRILASRSAYAVSEPGAGDIAVFARPESWGSRPEHNALRVAVGWIGDVVGFGPSNQDALVKRIIGVPGSTVRCCTDQGQVEVDGEPLDEGYIAHDQPFIPGVIDCSTTPASPRCFPRIEVPEGAYFVLGDNRANSADSAAACRGLTTPAPDCPRFVPRDDMIGKVVAIVWPLERARLFDGDS